MNSKQLLAATALTLAPFSLQAGQCDPADVFNYNPKASCGAKRVQSVKKKSTCKETGVFDTFIFDGIKQDPVKEIACNLSGNESLRITKDANKLMKLKPGKRDVYINDELDTNFTESDLTDYKKDKIEYVNVSKKQEFKPEIQVKAPITEYSAIIQQVNKDKKAGYTVSFLPSENLNGNLPLYVIQKDRNTCTFKDVNKEFNGTYSLSDLSINGSCQVLTKNFIELGVKHISDLHSNKETSFSEAIGRSYELSKKTGGNGLRGYLKSNQPSFKAEWTHEDVAEGAGNLLAKTFTYAFLNPKGITTEKIPNKNSLENSLEVDQFNKWLGSGEDEGKYTAWINPVADIVAEQSNYTGRNLTEQVELTVRKIVDDCKTNYTTNVDAFNCVINSDNNQKIYNSMSKVEVNK